MDSVAGITGPSPISQEDLELYIGFGEECSQKVEELEELVLKLEAAPENSEIPKEIYRILHTIKGTAASIGLVDLSRYAHKFEDYIVPFREGTVLANSSHTTILLGATQNLKTAMSSLKEGCRPTLNASMWSAPAADKTPAINPNSTSPPSAPKETATDAIAKPRKISVGLEVIDEVLARSGNLTIIRDLLLQDLEDMSSRFPNEGAIKRSIAYLTDMEKENDSLQTHIGNLRKTGIASALRAIQRAVRDLALQLGKKVKLEMTGTNVQVDYDVCQVLADSLVHIVRNSLDHGIEAPEERIATAKPPEAKVHVNVSQANDELVITVGDDGRGIDPERIRKKALDKRLVPIEKLATMNDEAILQLIFESGFSTAEKITEVSGRGVGLDMVMRSITGLKGKVQVTSRLKEGTQFTITIPEKKVTNIMSAFVVSCHGQKLAIPRDHVSEIKSIEQLQVRNRFFRRKGLPFASFGLKHLEIIEPFHQPSGAARDITSTPGNIVMFLDDSAHCAAVCVDEVYSVDKVIVKDFTGAPGVSSFEKAALSGRFGLLLLFDLQLAVKLHAPSTLLEDSEVDMSEMDDAFVLELRTQFCHETLELVQTVESILMEIEKTQSFTKAEELKRQLHCLKGNARAVGFDKISKAAHEIESICTEQDLKSKIDGLLQFFDRIRLGIETFLATQDATELIHLEYRQ